MPETVEVPSDRVQGKVKWFNSSKGYGFIVMDGAVKKDPEVFVHYSAIAGTDYRTLKDNQRVEFSVEKGPKGLTASNVVIIQGEV